MSAPRNAHSNRVAKLAAALGLLALSSVAGCGSSPTPRFYAINPIASGLETEPVADPAQIGVVVGPVTIPRYLQRPQIVSRSEDSRIHYDEFNRWGGNLESEVLRVLGQNLGVLLQTDRIIVYPRRAPFPTAYRVHLDFERFDATPGDALVLHARWVILPPEGGDAVAVEVTHVREPLSGSSVREIVRAHGAALEVLSRAIAARIEQLEQAASP